MIRQLLIYDRICGVPDVDLTYSGTIAGPDDLMKRFGISKRMLQRDLKDLRDCGLINVKLSRSRNRYLDAGDATFDETAGERRKQHLRRLNRLGTLIIKLSKTPYSLIEDYESGLRMFEDILDMAGEDPEGFPPDYIEYERERIPDPPPLFDLKAEYYELFPGSNERTRQRDFKALADAGFELYYSKFYKSYIFVFDDLAEPD